jgi:DNA-binding FadR family transcriptional regulator
MDEDLIPALATATGAAWLHLSTRQLNSIGTSLEQTIMLPRKPNWDRKAAAHARFYRLLAEAVGDPDVAPVLELGVVLMTDLAVAAGPGADGIIATAHRRLLAYLIAGDPDAAEQESDSYLRCLHYMSRLVAS